MDEVNFSERIVALEESLNRIHARNKRVETDKAWETSNTRKAFISLLTYLVTSIVFSAIGAGRPFVNALIPTAGYFLSTVSLRFIRRKWEAWTNRRES